MYSFIPQLLIILSIAGIILIVLRRLPEAKQIFGKVNFKDLPSRSVNFLRTRMWPGAKFLLQKLWHFALDVKQFSKNKAVNYFPKKFSAIHLPRPKFPIFKSPDSAEFYLSQGLESLEREDYADAERKFIRAIEKDPKNEAAYEGLGKIYLAQRKFKDAIDTYKYLVKMYPANDNYYSKLGQSCHSEKLYDRAIEAYEKAIELAPENPRRYVNLGLTLEAKKHLEEAILNYRRALDLDKENTQFIVVLAEALVKKGDKEEAEVLLERVLQIEPTNHLARERLMQLKF